MLAWLLLAALAATGLAWAAARAVRRRRGRVAAALVAVLVWTAVAAGGLQLWARASLDSSGVARAVVWTDADVDDRLRFPSLPVPAGDDVLPLRPGSLPAGVLDEVTVPGSGAEDLEQLLRRTRSTSFVVLRGDEVLLEWYGEGRSRESLQTSFSVAKSVLSTLVGIAIGRGEIGGLDDPVTAYVPELLDRDPRFADVTLRHLVTMSSGLAYEEQGLPWSDDALTYYDPDLRALALTAEIVEPPGRTWLYNNYNPLLVGLALERAVGRPVEEYAAEVLWGPMGAEADASWSADSEAQRFPKMESGFNARALDYARFGLLFAREGRAGDRQVVPADWVAEATARDTSGDPAEHYQYWWWLDLEREGRFLARGNKGQFVAVDPASDVVVVRTGREAVLEDWPAVLRDVTDRVVAAGR
ncbi:CubicO group peptidase, beta-lactamase class C family [Geodermatophilus dictyosporus]|uniref:CubicO group peptidase, beta-lactamase class C family n=1 Tax=Geodermatophilus dictyosporus TaxID=1523247 RepID=A0A1I5JB62_9ACTN|nr:serine hydrolase [Geodermatophilus dictyosporus]SFO70055.1 CubicO group peptidase, beta-lactamase class C family [Geodermatophilus dictyosporus]